MQTGQWQVNTHQFSQQGQQAPMRGPTQGHTQHACAQRQHAHANSPHAQQALGGVAQTFQHGQFAGLFLRKQMRHQRNANASHHSANQGGHGQKVVGAFQRVAHFRAAIFKCFNFLNRGKNGC